MYSVSQAKHNAVLKKMADLKLELCKETARAENLQMEVNTMKELLSEDLVAENAKLKMRIAELEYDLEDMKYQMMEEYPDD